MLLECFFNLRGCIRIHSFAFGGDIRTPKSNMMYDMDVENINKYYVRSHWVKICFIILGNSCIIFNFA